MDKQEEVEEEIGSEITAERRLLDYFQHDFPVCERPFAEVAQSIDIDETALLSIVARLSREGTISRVGPVFRPHRVGTSTLAAMQLPPERLDPIAELVTGYREVNHNYERDHRFNLWFVVTAPDDEHLHSVLADIELRSGFPVMSLPMLEAYHLDLGFPLARETPHRGEAGGSIVRPMPQVEPIRRPLSIRDASDRYLVTAVQEGLPLVSRPYAAVAEKAGLTEAQVIKRLQEWLRDGTIARMGVVVRHRELGYRANAMVVWDVPDDDVTALGRCFARYEFVNLCYRRVRRLPNWPYNLFCMIHGHSRGAVEERVRLLIDECGIAHIPHALLFGTRRFKQRGAYYGTSSRKPGAVARHGHG